MNELTQALRLVELSDQQAREARYEAKRASQRASDSRRDVIQVLIDTGRTDLLMVNMPKVRRELNRRGEEYSSVKVTKKMRSIG